MQVISEVFRYNRVWYVITTDNTNKPPFEHGPVTLIVSDTQTLKPSKNLSRSRSSNVANNDDAHRITLRVL